MTTEILRSPLPRLQRTVVDRLRYITTTKAAGYDSSITGLSKTWIFWRIHLNLLWIAIRQYRNPIQVITVLKSLEQLRKKFLGDVQIKKMVKVNGKYYWDLYTPGWKSNVFYEFLKAELARISPASIKTNRFLNVFISITKKCPLRCEHCFEWNSLNTKDGLTLNDLKKIVARFQSKGVSQIQFTGGEPMLRVHDLVAVLESASKQTDFWVLTSGFNFTHANAAKLKEAGLTGVVISLDHFDPEHHNAFRGHSQSFEIVQAAVKNALAANLVVALSICVTRSFATESNLMKYAELAKSMHVPFIQLLEPKAVGHYQGLDVLLKAEHEQTLSNFYLKMNSDKKYITYPIVCYHGYYQRRLGCLAAGDRSLYVDADGDLHSCPFSPAKRESILVEDIDPPIHRLRETGCHSFKQIVTQ